MARRRRIEYRTKKGEYGTLYQYKIPFKELGQDSGYGTYRGVARVWAYDVEDALDRFYESPDADDFTHTAKPKRVQEK